MQRLNIDIETRCLKDLTKVGVYAYADDPSFSVLLFGYAIDGGAVTVIDLARGEKIPEDVMSALTDDSVVKWAFNAQFERVCIGKMLGITLKPDSWHCTMVAGLYLGLPGSLAQVGAVFNFEKQKLKSGSDLIKIFSVPHYKKGSKEPYFIEPDDEPEKYEEFIRYNCRDVETEMEIYDKVSRFPVPGDVWQQYALDQRINDTGIKLDIPFVEKAIECDGIYSKKYLDRAQELTGLLNPNSPLQLKNWLTDQGVAVDSLNKDEVKRLMEDCTGEALELLELRQLMAKSSVKKYIAMQNCVCSDGRAHGLFQYYGTHTGRWAGRLIQLQNLPQNHIEELAEARALLRSGNYEAIDLLFDSIPDTLSQLIRTAFIPKDGKQFIVADYHSIECIVGAWVSRESWKVEAYAKDEDLYCKTAERMFGKPCEKHGVNSDLRKYGKLMELAGSYGGGPNAMKAFGAIEMGLKDEELQPMVDAWRNANPKIVQCWWDVDAAIITAVRDHKKVDVGCLSFYTRAGMLFVRLPSGRELIYQKPRIEINDFGRDGLVYEGLNMSKKWTSIMTRGSRVYENCIQAISRDLLAEAMQRLEKAGYTIVMHVHDECVVEADKYTKVEDICHIMEEIPAWAPGLTVRADGYSCEFYKKD